MDITVYLPDTLGTWAKDQKLNLSGILRAGVEAEKERARAADKLGETEFERVEVYDGKKERDVAFQGKKAGADWDKGTTVYLTPKGHLAVVGEGGTTNEELLIIYDGFEDFRVAFETGYCHSGYSFELVAEVAATLGEQVPVEELDI